MKFAYRVIMISIAAVLLELLYFNFQPLKLSINADLERNIVYYHDNLEFINWNKSEDGRFISMDDPQILIPSPQMKIVSVEVAFQTEPESNDCLFFFTNSEGIVEVAQGQKIENGVRFEIDQTAGRTTRVDIGDAAGIELKNVSVIFNPTNWNISISRIVTVILIYVSGYWLFQIQRMPDYGLEMQIKAKKEENQ
ncbi:MAG: hypothetical protein HFE97_00440 [Oscillospiraceae bacterium]|nr:hypothetical protein [Oscillospiraceae bacterium]